MLSAQYVWDMEQLPNGAIPSPFHELDAVSPEQLEDCLVFLDNVYLVVTSLRKSQPDLDRVYAVLDKIQARAQAKR